MFIDYGETPRREPADKGVMIPIFLLRVYDRIPFKPGQLLLLNRFGSLGEWVMIQKLVAVLFLVVGVAGTAGSASAFGPINLPGAADTQRAIDVSFFGRPYPYGYEALRLRVYPGKA